MSRELLVHDLTHDAVEAEAGLALGFWGLLASGRSFEELRTAAPAALSGDAPSDRDIQVAERIVGPMSSLVLGRIEASRIVEMGLAFFVDAAFVERVLERMRSLLGRWRATP